MGKLSKSSAPEVTRRFVPVHVDLMDFATLPINLYIRHEDDAAPTLFRSTGIEYRRDDAKRLIEHGVRFLYILASDYSMHRKALNARLTRTFHDPGLPRAERTRVIRESCARMIEDLFVFPDQPEMVSAIAEVSRCFLSWSGDNPSEFSHLLDMAAHDYYTASHMVNVGVGCGLLARRARPGDDEFFMHAVQGGLLHDIGKRGVPESILNKEGRLDPDEWRVLREHPNNGYNSLRKQPGLPEAVLSVVRNHHERIDGKGYPRGLSGDALDIPSRLGAIVDVFDAITFRAPYRGPTPAADVLFIMNQGRGSHFDENLLDTWSDLVNECIRADPSRALPPSPSGPALTLDETLACPPSGPVPGRPNRRRHPRFRYGLATEARFEHRAANSPLPVGAAFPVQVLDVARSGRPRIRTSWPVVVGDVLRLELRASGDHTLSCAAKVVRVDPADTGWIAGLAFIAEDSVPEAA